MDNIQFEKIDYRTKPCYLLTEEEIKKFKDLFDHHYGVWASEGSMADKAGDRIQFPLKHYRQYCKLDNAYVAYASVEDTVIGHAFYIRDSFPNNKTISWVLQLVVHEQYRRHGVAKTLLYSIWGFSGDYGWGLATSNALTVNTLERATFHKVRTDVMKRHENDIIMIKEKVPFAKDAQLSINRYNSVLDSKFPVDQKTIQENLRLYNGEWRLGTLEVGYEWVAFTFSDQEFELDNERFNELFRNSEHIVKDAYGRMELDEQKWNKHHPAEVEFIIQQIDCKPSMYVMDFGCGTGRHALEFAKRGYQVTGIDYSEKNIDRVRLKDCYGAEFIVGDCRDINIGKKADLALCLYDVVGSYTTYEDNFKIVCNIFRHLKNGAYLFLSVLNLELTSNIAIHKTKEVSQDPEQLLSLRPSGTMKESGNIFLPDYFLLETNTGIVYRKEQFENDGQLSAEYVIRDKRYSGSEISNMLERAGFNIKEIRYVQAGRWDKPLESTDAKAKEILVIACKE